MNAVVLVMGTDYYVYNQFFNVFRGSIEKSNLNVLGITSNDKLYSAVDGFEYIPLEKLAGLDIDIIVVAACEYPTICNWIMNSKHIHAKYVIPMKVFGVPGFDLDKYIRILDSELSIISDNCWGGITYNSLGLPFRSPFINMFMSDEDYIELLSNFDYYMKNELTLLEWGYEQNLQREYPICSLGGVVIHFNHYTSMEEVNDKWKSRSAKLNYKSLFVEFGTTSKEMACKFDRLPYENKVCFVPADMDIAGMSSVVALPFVSEEIEKNNDFGIIVDSLAEMQLVGYDVFELLMGHANVKRV